MNKQERQDEETEFERALQALIADGREILSEDSVVRLLPKRNRRDDGILLDPAEREASKRLRKRIRAFLDREAKVGRLMRVAPDRLNRSVSWHVPRIRQSEAKAEAHRVNTIVGVDDGMGASAYDCPDIAAPIDLCSHGKAHPHEIAGLYEPGKPRHHGFSFAKCPGPAPIAQQNAEAREILTIADLRREIRGMSNSCHVEVHITGGESFADGISVESDTDGEAGWLGIHIQPHRRPVGPVEASRASTRDEHAIPGLYGHPYAGSRCGECGRHADDHFRLDHDWKAIECSRDGDGRHVWSQAGDSYGNPCLVCGRRSIRHFPEDWEQGPASETDFLDADHSCPRVHDLKIWPSFFDDVVSGAKPFEVRKDDRGFAIGDTLRLKEWSDEKYTGRMVVRRVSYVLRGPVFGIKAGYVVLGLDRVPELSVINSEPYQCEHCGDGHLGTTAEGMCAANAALGEASQASEPKTKPLDEEAIRMEGARDEDFLGTWEHVKGGRYEGLGIVLDVTGTTPRNMVLYRASDGTHCVRALEAFVEEVTAPDGSRRPRFRKIIER